MTAARETDFDLAQTQAARSRALGEVARVVEKNKRLGREIERLQRDIGEVRRQRDEQAARAAIAERRERDMRREHDGIRERMREVRALG